MIQLDHYIPIALKNWSGLFCQLHNVPDTAALSDNVFFLVNNSTFKMTHYNAAIYIHQILVHGLLYACNPLHL